MDNLVASLGPAFAAGFAVQRLLEILDPLLDKALSEANEKKAVLGLVAAIVGIVMALTGVIKVLDPLGVDASTGIEVVVTGLVISGGTEAMNSIMKFLGYKKEEKKNEAIDARNKVSAEAAVPAAG